MTSSLKVTIGQYSDRGRKQLNQDFHGAMVPDEPLLHTKGVAVAIADGISTSDLSHIASESAVKGFLHDYYCTSESWTVKTSALRVLVATNSWLHSQSQRSAGRYVKDKGYVCTFSALVVKSNTVHVFHVGDARIYRLTDSGLEQLTTDHRVTLSEGQVYLGRALGVDSQLDIEYQSLPVAQGDYLVLATDGVYEHLEQAQLVAELQSAGDRPELDSVARGMVEKAVTQGSEDNLTLQLVRIDQLPSPEAVEIHRQLSDLPCPPVLEPRSLFDGYRIARVLHRSSRSHVYLAEDHESGQAVVIKTPSIDLRDDPNYLDRFLMEEWVARRVNSTHVLQPCRLERKRNYLYVATEYLEGQTLSQWMIDHPVPELETVRGIVEQIARGLRAFHRMEMLHQDLRPENIMIDGSGTVKIIDFGSVRVAGLVDSMRRVDDGAIRGTVQYTAPEYFLGEPAGVSADLFSLGVIGYQMLSGTLPYGAALARARTRAAQRRLQYRSVLCDDREIPAWIDHVLCKAVHIDPTRRYQELSEFVYDLRHPSPEFLARARPPLLERNPVAFWKAVSLVLLITVLFLCHRLAAVAGGL